MSKLFDIRKKARVGLHQAMQLDSLCYVPGAAEAVPVTVRLHTSRGPVGDLPGTSLAYAERLDEDPTLVFLVEEHTPARGHVYALEGGAVYRAESVNTPDNETISAVAVLVRPQEATAFPGPV